MTDYGVAKDAPGWPARSACRPQTGQCACRWLLLSGGQQEALKHQEGDVALQKPLGGAGWLFCFKSH